MFAFSFLLVAGIYAKDDHRHGAPKTDSKLWIDGWGCPKLVKDEYRNYDTSPDITLTAAKERCAESCRTSTNPKCEIADLYFWKDGGIIWDSYYESCNVVSWEECGNFTQYKDSYRHVLIKKSTVGPTKIPTARPTVLPTITPSKYPTSDMPTTIPTNRPTGLPTPAPTEDTRVWKDGYRCPLLGDQDRFFEPADSTLALAKERCFTACGKSSECVIAELFYLHTSAQACTFISNCGKLTDQYKNPLFHVLKQDLPTIATSKYRTSDTRYWKDGYRCPLLGYQDRFFEPADSTLAQAKARCFTACEESLLCIIAELYYPHTSTQACTFIPNCGQLTDQYKNPLFHLLIQA